MTATPDPNQKLQTLSIHSGRHVDPATGAVTTPLYTSTTFERDPDGAFSRRYFYSRIDNPNRHSLEQCLADLADTEVQILMKNDVVTRRECLKHGQAGGHASTKANRLHAALEICQALLE